MASELVEEFEYYKVDMVFSGHNHFYERSKVLNDQGTYVHYVVTGGGGAPLHNPFGGDVNPYRVPGRAQSVRHYCLMRVTSGLQLRVYTENQEPIDSYTIK